MSSHSRCVEVRLPQTIRLADLYEIRLDLQAAAQWCEEAIRFGQTIEGLTVAQGLTTAAVIRYARCFVSGVRLSLKTDDLAGLDAATLASHAYFLDLRNRFVAHAVNAFEETYVTATVSQRDGVKQPVTGVNAGQLRLVLAAGAAMDLYELTQKVTSIVAASIATEERQVLAFLQSLPLETIHGFELHQPSLMERHRVAETRARGVNKR
jgi:hypothetical protein